MKKTKLHTMYGKKIIKGILVGVMSCMMIGNLLGCGLLLRGRQTEKEGSTDQKERYSYREEKLSWEVMSDEKNAEELITTLTAALETKDADAIKEMFSPYALEHAENLDEKIEELIEFYPGCNGGYEFIYTTHKSNNYGVKEYVLSPKFTITNDNEVYRLRITAYIENDVDPDKLGIYSIQVMTKEAEPEGFKWRDEEDEPGVYVLE